MILTSYPPIELIFVRNQTPPPPPQDLPNPNPNSGCQRPQGGGRGSGGTICTARKHENPKLEDALKIGVARLYFGKAETQSKCMASKPRYFSHARKQSGDAKTLSRMPIKDAKI